MKTSRKMLVVVVLALIAAASGTAWAIAKFNARPTRPEYPDSPFKQVSQAYPRILPIRDYPSGKDFAAQNRYWDEHDRVRKYLREEGALARATPQEREAYLTVLDAVQKSKDGFVKARVEAAKVLGADPQSPIGHFVMAKVEHYGEANLPRALFEIRQARRLLELRGQTHPDDADAREWYILVLYEEYQILNSMDRREEQLRVVDLIEQVYQPMPWLRLFPLIKVKKFAEVEKLLETIEREGHWPRTAVNTRLMLAEQRRDRQGVYQTGKDMVNKIPNSGVLWFNFGGSCLNDFRLEEAETAFIKSTNNSYDFNNSAYFPLSGLYLQEGRFQEAWQSLNQGQAQRARRKPHTLQQDQTTADRSIAQTLLALGKAEEAERFARRAFERPGRVGSTTSQERDDTFANGFLLWLTLEARSEQLQENQDSTGLAGAWNLQALRAESWALKQQLLKILGDEEFLKGVLRPNLPGQAGVETWQLGSVLNLLPAGVAEEALAQARQEEKHPAAAPYFDAMAAEMAWAQGRHEEALMLVRKAMDKLPATGEKLLRARIAAVGAEAARRLGRPDDARPLAEQALRDFPAVFRMLGFRIPIRVENDGSPLARQTATQLLGSARFRQDTNGFRVQVRQAGDQVLLTMHRNANEIHVQVEVDAKGELAKAAAKACTRFHERMMSPLLDLTPVDVNAVDQLPRPQG